MPHRDKICKAIADALEVPVTLQSHRCDTPEWDSVNHLRLLLAVEQSLAVEIPQNQWGSLTSVQAIVETVERQLGINPTKKPAVPEGTTGL